MKKKITKRDKVLAYKDKHPDASVNKISKAVGVSYSYVWKIVGNKDTQVVKEVAAKKSPRFRSEVLFTAEQIVSNDREKEHGDAKDNWDSISGLWSSFLGHTISPSAVPIMLMLIKVARLRQNKSNIDNYVDICGYAALASESRND